MSVKIFILETHFLCVKKSLIISWRILAEVCNQKKLVAFLLLYPLLFMIIFGSVFGRENPISFSLAIARGGNDDFSDSIISIFKEAFNGTKNKIEIFEEGNKSIEEEAKILIEKGFDIVIFIPKDFSKIMFSTVNISIFYDASADINVKNVAIGTVTGILNSFSKKISEEKIKFAENLGLSKEEIEYIKSISEPINISMTNISFSSRQLKYIDFVVPGLIEMTIMWSGIIGAASSLVEDRVTGIRERILSTPTPPSSLILGNMFAHLALIGLQITILLLVAVCVFKLTIVGSIALASLVIIIGIFLMIGIGFLISSFSKTQEEANQLGMLISFPMMFFSGTFFPITGGWLYYVSRIFPLTYVNEALRKVMIKGSGLAEIKLPVIILIIFLIFVFLLGTLMERRE